MQGRKLFLPLFLCVWVACRHQALAFVSSTANKNIYIRQTSLEQKPTLFCKQKDNEPTNKDLVSNLAASAFLATNLLFWTFATPHALAEANPFEEGPQGLPVVTQSDFGKSIRGTVVRGAQFADKLDLQWERFSDSLRDENKCDPRTNRRMFDNGFRRDGTRIGNPVLGALCTPEPLKELDESMATLVLDLGKAAGQSTLKTDATTLAKQQESVEQLVGPSFSRALSSTEDPQTTKRQEFNKNLYMEMRALGELTNSRETARLLEQSWGDQILSKLAPNGNRNDYNSPFPKPDDVENQPYDEGALLDALGAVSVALDKLQQDGLIGHWDISIPEDDDWNVVTIAVDDDISIGGQMLARGRNQPLDGSEVTALVRAAMEKHLKIPYKLDTFFIDPTTTKQELYNPTQLLISLSDLGQ